MSPLDIQLLIVALVLFIAAPYLPSSIYAMAFTNMIVPAILLIALLVSMNYSFIGSIALFLAVAALFIENRRRTFQEVKAPTYEQQMAPAQPVVPGEIHPAPDTPSALAPSVKYAPSEDATNEFQRVGTSVNMKKAMASPRVPADAEKYIIEHSLAEVPH
jgi:hypothetical protein